ncbi:MAG: trimeric autotransporter adhesin [Actinoplanes sp.]|jgi:hypothetical protein|nr:trimeric autotransporter adhesin [Actinoplanes sp.]
MRNSTSRTRSRLIAAGLTTGAVTAALLVAPTAAWAGVGTVSPLFVPALMATSASVTDSTAIFTTSSLVQIRQEGGTCNTTRAAAAGTVVDVAGTPGITNSTHTITFIVPATVTAGTNGAPKSIAVCIYAATTLASASLSTSSITVLPSPILSATAGPTGGGNLLNISTPAGSAFLTGLTGFGAFFSSSPCAATYGTPTGNMVAVDATRLGNTSASLIVPAGVVQTASTTGPTAYQLCLYNGSTSAATLIAAGPYGAGVITLAPASGPSGGGNGITVSSASPFLAGYDTPGILFTTEAACRATYDTSLIGSVTPIAVVASDIRKLTDNRLALNAPALTLVASLPTTYNLCIYRDSVEDTSQIVQGASYLVSAPATPTGVSPSAGPATGGTVITVSGSGFPDVTDTGTISAMLGGVPLTNIVKVNTSAFQATTPRHSADTNVPLVVTTAAGTKALQNAFSFLNTLSVRPNTAPNTTVAVNLEIGGSGFLGYTFGANAGANAQLAHVFLVGGVYNPAATAAGARANGPLADCGSVLVTSDESLVCTLRLDKRLDLRSTATGANPILAWDPSTYSNLSIVATTTAGSPIIGAASGGTFSNDDIGQLVKEDTGNVSIPAGLVITQVLSTTRAVMSGNAIASTGGAIDIGNAVSAGTYGAASQPGRSIANISWLTLSKTLVASTTPGGTQVPGTFSSTDVGRVLVAGTGITVGTTIVAVSPNGATATLSTATSNTASAATIALFPPAAVPVGAYSITVVSNGNVDAATADPNYQQSVVSSGATFTVAPS